MAGQYGAFRSGWDAPARIATSTQMLAESSEVLVAEPTYAPLIPFPAAGLALSNGASTSSTENDEWKQYPGRLDLFAYQGDDVQIPMFFSDPSDWDIDMSFAAGWQWKSQIRLVHRYHSVLVNEFSIAADYIPPVPEDEQPQGVTQVTCFLPRYCNKYVGRFHWDIQSTGPFAGPEYPTPPEGIDPEDWPPDNLIKTWLYGLLYVVPRVTATDFLPPQVITTEGAVVAVTPQGFAVGPNGRVP